MKVKKALWTILVALALGPSLALGAISTDGGINKDPAGGAIYTNTNCDQSQYYKDGTICQDTDDNKLYLGTGAAVIEIGSGSGDVSGVGDCASGACLDGSDDGGTFVRLYDGTSAYISQTAGVRTLTLVPSNANAESLVITFGDNSNVVALSSGTGGVVNISGSAATAVGLAGTATALAADPANCAAGQIAIGVNASGVAECTATPSGLTSVGATTFTGALTGAASGNIPNTLADAAGDLIQASANDTWAKLAKGAEGTLIQAGASVHAATTYALPTADCTENQILKANSSGDFVCAADATGGGTTMANDAMWAAEGDIAIATGNDAGAVLTKGAAGTILRAGAARPAYSTATFADTYTKGTFLYNAAANTVASLAHPGAANYILTTNATDTSAWLQSSANMISLLGSADYATARTNLGLAIGTNVQAYDAELAAIAGLTFADASIIQLTGAAAAATLTSGGNNYFLKSTSDNSAVEFATPANALTAIGAQPLLSTAGADLIFAAPTELTLSSNTDGNITATQVLHTVDTFEDAASGALDTIAAGTDGQVLYLRAAHTDRTVVLDETDNIVIPYGSTLSLDTTSLWIKLLYDAGLSKWVVVSGLPDSVNLSSVNLTSGELILPTATDPDVGTAGEISYDSDGANVTGDASVRASDGTNQWLLGRKLHDIHVTVVKPQDMADAVRDAFLVWSNETGMTFTVTGWKCWAGADDTSLNIETTAADGSSNATVDAVECATGGGPYTGSDTTITAGTIAAGSLIWLDFDDTDDPSYVKLTITGWFNANVD